MNSCTFNTSEIAIRIRDLRLKNNLKSWQMAGALRMDPSQYSKIEKGKLLPTVAHLYKLHTAFNVSADWILFGKSS